MLPERKQVLIVDDEPNLRKILSAQLTRDGYDVLTAEDGEQGLALLAEHHIDLVITDLKMPKVDGMTLLKRALVDEPELPVVLITAHGTIDTAVEALKSGAFDFVTKPFDKDEVRQIVAKALKTRELRGADAVEEILHENVWFERTAGFGGDHKQRRAEIDRPLDRPDLCGIGAIEHVEARPARLRPESLGQHLRTQARAAHAEQDEVCEPALLYLIRKALQPINIGQLLRHDVEPAKPFVLVNSGP